MKRDALAVTATLLSLSLASSAAAQANLGGAPGNCDKACLTAMADAYFAALVAHDPSKAAMAPTAKFTENAQVVKVGEGLWKTATEAPTSFKVYVPDPIAGQLGAIVLMRVAGKPIQLALRIKVVNKQTTEAEHIIARNVNEANFQTPRPGLFATVPPAERIPRGLMLVVGHSYYDALEQSDGSAAPFADDCSRRENGMTTGGVGAGRGGAPGGPAPAGGARGTGAAPRAGGLGFGPSTCAAQIDTRTFYYITSIDLRRVWIADEEKGLVFGLSMFRHPMEEKIFDVIAADGTRTPRDMTKQNPFDFESVHILKIQRGQIHEIEAMGISLPYKSKNGWSDFWR
jgi:hypothetical protein